MDFTVIYLGGSEAAMKCRCEKSDERTDELRKLGHNVKVIFTGFKSEITYFKGNSKFSKDRIEGDAYDSVTNLLSQLEELLKAEKIVISTGYYHFRSIREIIVPENFPELSEKLIWVPSGEIEGIVGRIRFHAYAILRSKIMGKLAVVTRWSKFLEEFLIPLYKKANAGVE